MDHVTWLSIMIPMRKLEAGEWPWTVLTGREYLPKWVPPGHVLKAIRIRWIDYLLLSTSTYCKS